MNLPDFRYVAVVRVGSGSDLGVLARRRHPDQEWVRWPDGCMDAVFRDDAGQPWDRHCDDRAVVGGRARYGTMLEIVSVDRGVVDQRLAEIVRAQTESGITACPRHTDAHRITRRRCAACCALEERAPIATCTGNDRGHPERAAERARREAERAAVGVEP